MRNTLDSAGRRLASVIHRLTGDEAGEISEEVGFHFSAWFFLALVMLSLLDAYVFEGRGIGHYLSLPNDALANARAMLNV